ncbi:MAG: mechanosensitive ion channel [Sedimentisphaerales bacterium]|nr:mechanosensitive ion channel [Sedimentisphaerales bacterium]MBN2843186.1 mechanosensitive ion channel [Sedimentisphaerales bacterium]
MRKIVVILFVLLSCSVQLVLADTTDPVVVSPQAVENPFTANIYKADDISARLKALESRTELLPADKDRLAKLYTDSLDRIREIEALLVTNTEYENSIKNAPDELKKIKKQMAEGLSVKEEYNDSISLEESEQKLAALELELGQVQKENTRLAGEPQRRAARRNEIPVEIASINDRLLKPAGGGVEAGSETTNEEVRQATVMFNTLSETALKCKARTLENELAMYNARIELLDGQREYYEKRQQILTEQVKLWREGVNSRRKDQAEAAKGQAQTIAKEVDQNYPVLSKISEDNLSIAEKQSELVDKIEAVGREQKEIEVKLKDLQSDYDRVRKMVQEVGSSPAIGFLLHNKRWNLPDIEVNKHNLKKRLAELSDSQFDLLDYDEKRAMLMVMSEAVRKTMSELDMPEGQRRTELMAKVEELLTAQRKSLETLVNFYSNYTATLTAIDVKEREFVAKYNEYSNFIDEHILWVKNTQSMSLDGLRQTGTEIKHIISVFSWKEIFVAVPLGIVQEIANSLLLWLLLLLAYVMRFGNRRRLRQLAAKVATPEHDRYSYTLIALFTTIIYSLPLPLTLYVIGKTISYGAEEMVFARALASALISLAYYDFVMLPLKNVFMGEGLAVSHFNYSKEQAGYYYRIGSWFVIIMQPLLIMLYVQHSLEGLNWKSQICRLVFIAIMMLFSAFLALVFYPGKSNGNKDEQEQPAGIFRLQNLLRLAGILVPLTLAVMAWNGYFYAAWQLEVRMFAAFWSAMIFKLFNSLVVRRIYLARGNILAGFGKKPEAEKKPNTELAEDAISAEEVDEYCGQIARFVRFVLSFAYLLSLFVIFRDVFPALAVLDKVQLWQVTSSDQQMRFITLTSLLSAFMILVVTIMMARNITGLINITLLKSIGHKEGSRFAVLALIRYCIVIFGVCWSFTRIGIGWDKVQWLAAAFTVGLGFGLQEIFANFVSGIILLFEQPMRVGDIVTVGEVSGRVTHINTRSTTINCWDRRELIIPNKEFITGKLMNWTLSDNLNRIVFQIGVAYGSDLEKVEKTLMRIARFQKGVVWKPKPRVIFKAFGDNTLNFELRVYINDMDDYTDVWHGINCTIDAEFRKEGIEIAFPQRDLHIRSISCGPVPVRIDTAVTDKPASPAAKLVIKEADNEQD